MTTDGPSCTLDHAEHLATWQSWRDDCAACGFGMQDPDQCERGHPDDGLTFCGACGYDTVYNTLKPGELTAIVVKAEAAGINTVTWSISSLIRAFPLTESESAEVARKLDEAYSAGRARRLAAQLRGS